MPTLHTSLYKNEEKGERKFSKKIAEEKETNRRGEERKLSEKERSNDQRTDGRSVLVTLVTLGLF